jgi:starch-binding outer membrane protein, SusD/RagB family
MKSKKMKSRYYFLLLAVLALSCKKSWLDAKPKNSLVVPNAIKDYQAILDNTYEYFNLNQPGIGEIACGDLYVQDAIWSALTTPIERNGYIWSEDGNYQNGSCTDWSAPYSQILYSNIALSGIEKIKAVATDLNAWKNVKGSALFYRAFAEFNLLQAFASGYNPSITANQAGIPLKMSDDINEQSVRSPVQQCYEQVESDLLAAKELLPITPLYKTRPSKIAVFAMLARIDLCKQDYDHALQYADSSLALNNTLMNYNTDPNVKPSATNSITALNPEDIFHATMCNYIIFRSSRAIVDSFLYRLYDVNDLRRTVFFFTNGGQIRFKGSYDGSALLFCGLTTAETYLIRAECYARKGNVSSALADLNALAQKRWKTGSFVPNTATDANDALTKVLAERRRELCFRGLRWMDLKRLNPETRFSVTLTRVINGKTYTLPPNDNRYALPIPVKEVQLSGIEQNPR